MACLFAGAAFAQTPGGTHEAAFDAYTPLSGTAELIRRELSPLTAARLAQALSATHQHAREQAIDLTQEKFVVFVPAQQPPQGYGLLVFVPPWEDARMPAAWLPAFEHHGLIVISAAHSGNETSVLDRREPLALLAAHNALQRYRIDASRVFVGGFSGGSRVALRLALGYADLFRGALLNAGSDPIGDTQVPLPPRELFERFQSSRLIFLTGGKDAEHLEQDAKAKRSLRDWCVLDTATQPMAWTGHETADAGALDRALTQLDQHEAPAGEKRAACAARIDAELAQRLDAAAQLLDAGKRDKASAALDAIDARYGGLAAPRSVELFRRLEATP